ncbi:MAG: hypothetical protein ACP5NV_06190, partial [Candidatus Woesearchaeota archaeon]
MEAQTIQVMERDGLAAAERYWKNAKISETEREVLVRYFHSLLAGDCGKIKSHLTIRGAVFSVKSFAEFINMPLRNAQKQDIIDWTVSLRLK